MVSTRATNLRAAEQYAAFRAGGGVPTPNKLAHCGAEVTPFDWAFTDADHAVCSLAAGGCPPVCEGCRGALAALLAPVEDVRG